MSKQEFVERIIKAQAKRKKEAERELREYQIDAVARMKRRRSTPKGVVSIGKTIR